MTQEVDAGVIKLAVAGRPNVGKSTLINTWLGEERLVAFDLPGTTRDAISVPFERNGQRFELVDTAGLRRRGKVFEAIEKFSVVKTLQAIESANVVLLLIDATQGVTDQDAHIAGYILESGRAVVLAINKWDALEDEYQRELVKRSIETRLPFLKFAAMHFISAQKRQGLGAFVVIHRAGVQGGQLQDVDTHPHTPVAGGCAVPEPQAFRHVSAQIALCASGRHESACHHHSRQFPGTRDRSVQTLPGRTFSQGVRSGGHASSH
jgi:small GTP-binding protein